MSRLFNRINNWLLDLKGRFVGRKESGIEIEDQSREIKKILAEINSGLTGIKKRVNAIEKGKRKKSQNENSVKPNKLIKFGIQLLVFLIGIPTLFLFSLVSFNLFFSPTTTVEPNPSELLLPNQLDRLFRDNQKTANKLDLLGKNDSVINQKLIQMTGHLDTVRDIQIALDEKIEKSNDRQKVLLSKVRNTDILVYFCSGNYEYSKKFNNRNTTYILLAFNIEPTPHANNSVSFDFKGKINRKLRKEGYQDFDFTSRMIQTCPCNSGQLLEDFSYKYQLMFKRRDDKDKIKDNEFWIDIQLSNDISNISNHVIGTIFFDSKGDVKNPYL